MKKRIHAFLLHLLLGLNGVDAGTTIAMVRTGLAREMNPAMRLCLDIHPFFFLSVKLGLIEILVWMLWRRSDHIVARIGAYLVVAAYLALVIGQVAGICWLYPAR
jgi:hypothetical protein